MYHAGSRSLVGNHSWEAEGWKRLKGNMVKHSGDHHLLTTRVKASPSGTSSPLPRSFASSQCQAHDDISYPGGTSKPFEHHVRLGSGTDGHNTSVDA